MNQNEINIHPIFIVLIIVSLFGFVGYGLYRSKFIAPKTAERIEKKLFTPYFNLLSAGKIDEAWQQYTSPEYKKKYPLEQYRNHWQKVFSEKGKITKYETYNSNSSYDFVNDKKTEWFQYRIFFEKQKAGELLFYQTLINEQNVDLIDYAGRRLQGNQTISDRDRILAEPW